MCGGIGDLDRELRGKELADIMPADEKRKKAETAVTASTPAAEAAPEASPTAESTPGEAPAPAPQA